MSQRLRSTVRIAFPAVAAFALAAPAAAVPLQITNSLTYNNFGPSVSADGERIAFYSAADLTGGNPDNNFEIFLYDRPTHTLSQITDLAGGISAGGNQAPRISGDGNRIEFQHFAISGTISNFQTLYYDIPTNSFTTLTPLGFFEIGDINADGTRIVVQTGNTGTRIYDTTSNSFGAVFGNAQAPRIDGSGTRVVWQAFNGQVHLFDTTTSTDTPVNPPNSGVNQFPAISADGKRIVYSASANLTGGNPDLNPEIYLYDVQNGTTTQITSTNSATNFNAAISGDGTRIAFSSNADLTGGNPDHSFEIFEYDVLGNAFDQITSAASGFSDTPSFSADGNLIAYISSSNLSGDNPDGNPEIFIDALAPHAQAPESATPLLLAAGLLALWTVAMQRRGARRAAA
jgi:Tol biopolymer transport system component